jgi:hypothetical protein
VKRTYVFGALLFIGLLAAGVLVDSRMREPDFDYQASDDVASSLDTEGDGGLVRAAAVEGRRIAVVMDNAGNIKLAIQICNADRSCLPSLIVENASANSRRGDQSEQPRFLGSSVGYLAQGVFPIESRLLVVTNGGSLLRSFPSPVNVRWQDLVTVGNVFVAAEAGPQGFGLRWFDPVSGDTGLIPKAQFPLMPGPIIPTNNGAMVLAGKWFDLDRFLVLTNRPDADKAWRRISASVSEGNLAANDWRFLLADWTGTPFAVQLLNKSIFDPHLVGRFADGIVLIGNVREDLCVSDVGAVGGCENLTPGWLIVGEFNGLRFAIRPHSNMGKLYVLREKPRVSS